MLKDNLTRAGKDQHCRTCRARGRTRGWPVDRSSRSPRWKEPPPSRATLAQPLIVRRPALSNTMTCKNEIFRTLPKLSVCSSHPEKKSQRQKSSETLFEFLVHSRFTNMYLYIIIKNKNVFKDIRVKDIKKGKFTDIMLKYFRYNNGSIRQKKAIKYIIIKIMYL